MTSKEVDRHIAKLSEPKRSTLTALRKTIRELLPEAEEVISYGFPGYRLNGKIICGFDAFKNHCSYFPHSSKVVEACLGDLEGYQTSKGTIQFPVDRPLPKSLVRKLIQTRIRQLSEN